ncbi:hypothetical protein N0V88_006938 [Collariella sp. IMI 366227]|nr:hypothetical protein N0V88_006938 [Collariella sp. IMI 366227]
MTGSPSHSFENDDELWQRTNDALMAILDTPWPGSELSFFPDLGGPSHPSFNDEGGPLFVVPGPAPPIVAGSSSSAASSPAAAPSPVVDFSVVAFSPAATSSPSPTPTATCILTARDHGVAHAFAVAKERFNHWVTYLRDGGCAWAVCNSIRAAALGAFVEQSGLGGCGSELPKSLHEVFSALELITASSGDLAPEEDRLAWAAQIRQSYGGTCTLCPGVPTSMFFPLDDLLCSLSWDMQEKLLCPEL